MQARSGDIERFLKALGFSAWLAGLQTPNIKELFNWEPYFRCRVLVDSAAAAALDGHLDVDSRLGTALWSSGLGFGLSCWTFYRWISQWKAWSNSNLAATWQPWFSLSGNRSGDDGDTCRVLLLFKFKGQVCGQCFLQFVPILQIPLESQASQRCGCPICSSWWTWIRCQSTAPEMGRLDLFTMWACLFLLGGRGATLSLSFFSVFAKTDTWYYILAYDSAYTIFWLVCLMPLFPSWCFAKSQSLKFRRLLQQHRALIAVAEHQGKLSKAVCVCGLIRKGPKLFGWPCLSACFEPLFEQIEPRRHPGLEFVKYFYQHDGERDISSEGEEEAKRNASEGLQGQVVWVLHCSGRAFPNVDQQKEP